MIREKSDLMGMEKKNIHRKKSKTNTVKYKQILFFFIFILTASGVIFDYKTILSVTTILSLISIFIGLFKPKIGILGLGMLCVVDAPMRVFLTSGILRYNTFNYILLAIMLFYFPKILEFKHPQTNLLKFLIIFLAFELIFSSQLQEGFLHILSILVVFGFLISFYRANLSHNDWYWIAVVISCTSILNSMFFFIEFSNNPYINANALSFSSLGGLFAINLAMSFSVDRTKRYLLLWILAIIIATFIFLSGSRSGTLTAFISLIFLILQAQRFERRFTYIIIGILLVLAISSQFTDFQEKTLQRFDKLFDTSISYASRSSGRTDLALGGWYVFLEYPFGVGTGDFAPAWSDVGYQKGFYSLRGVGYEVPQHSAWLKILAENGLPGFLLLFSFVLSFAILGFKKQSKKLRILGLMVTTILGVIFLFTNFQVKSIWYLSASAMIILQE